MFFFNRRKKESRNKKEMQYFEKYPFQDIDLTKSNIEEILDKNCDIVFHDILINGRKDMKITLCYVEGLIDKEIVNNSILKELSQKEIQNFKSTKELVNFIDKGMLFFSTHKLRKTGQEVIYDILNGSIALIFDKEKAAITFDVEGSEKRSITEPTGENVIKGAKDAFIETLRVNTSIVRRKIKTSRLIIEETIVGKQTITSVAIVYLENIANEDVIEEVKKRLDSIDVDGIITTGFIEEYIVDNNFSIFPQVLSTERSDKFCSNILEGRIGIIIDGLPITFIIPGTLNMFIQAPEDYALNYLVNSLIRFTRYLLVLTTLLLPGFYVAITTFHQTMIPTELALSIMSSKEGVPFPTFIEAIFMLFAFEVLQEAGLRLPQNIGQAVSIVGALVVGQAAVEAKLVSPAIVVIISITGIAGFTIPNQDFSNAIRGVRFIMVLLASIIGLFGLSFGFILLIYHLSTLETFGVPYLSPFVGGKGYTLKDTIFRLPLKYHKKRPSSLKTTNKKRQK